MARTITIEYGGKAYVVPCEHQGNAIPPSHAADLFRQGKLKALAEKTTYQPAAPAPRAKLKKG